VWGGFSNCGQTCISAERIYVVDSVAEVVYLKSSEIDSAPNVGTEESAKFIQGVSNRDGELLILVDLNKLLSDEEWDELSNI
jgi:purine-binding chemotaxis protein CheW